MTILCNGTDISGYIAHGYTYTREPMYSGQSITTLDGTDCSAKLRDVVKLKLPFIPLKKAQLNTILQLFAETAAYVSVTFEDPYTNTTRTASMKYSTRSSVLTCVHRSGVVYYSGLVVELTER